MSDTTLIAWLAYLHLSFIIIPGLLATVAFGYLDYVRPWQKSLRHRWTPLHGETTQAFPDDSKRVA